jgi:Tol biopolymer transport system component
MPISEQMLQSTTGARQLTFGGGTESRASAANDGTVVYASSEIKPAVWSLAIDSHRGIAAGGPARIADAAGERVQPSISADGRRIAWRAGKELRVKDLQTGTEATLNAPDAGVPPPVISPDGARIAYAAGDGIFSLPFEGAAEPKRIAEHAGSPVAWSADGGRMLSQGWRRNVSMVYTETGERRDIIRSEDTNIYEPRFSPDGGWIAFHSGRPRGGRQIWVVPFHDGPRVKQSDWIPITEENGNSRNPCWSADGTLLYYLSERDGFRCVWAQRLDPATHGPKGQPFAVQHFHQARYSLTNPRNPLDTGLAASRDKLVFPVFETIGDVWMLRTSN